MEEAIIAWNRFGLGGRPGDQHPADARRWLLDQLDSFDPSPSVIAARPSTKQALAAYLEFRQQRREMRRQMEQSGMEAATAASDGQRSAEDRRRRRPIRQSYIDDVAARGFVAAESNAPFMERIVHFWANHFTVSIAKNQVRNLAGPYEFEAIRPNVLGSFADLLKASVLNPAMQVYLDQAQSIGPNSRAGSRARGQNRERGLNENLAREIMELHTLGARSGYSQTDVTEFAKALTGWTVDRGRRLRGGSVSYDDGSVFAPPLHEPGTQTIMGRSYPDRGEKQALDVLDDLATAPATAKHIATKLARHFAADEPPATMVARLKTAFLESSGDLPTVYRALIASPEAWVPEPRKFRQPWEWSIATLRATRTDLVNKRQFVTLLNELGQPAWGPASPAGFDDTMASWAGPDALVRRVEAAQRLAGRDRDSNARTLAVQLFGEGLNDTTATAIRRAESPAQGLALLLASPEMMRR